MREDENLYGDEYKYIEKVLKRENIPYTEEEPGFGNWIKLRIGKYVIEDGVYTMDLRDDSLKYTPESFLYQFDTYEHDAHQSDVEEMIKILKEALG